MDEPQTNLFDFLSDDVLILSPDKQLEFELSDVTSFVYSTKEQRFFTSWIDEEGEQYEKWFDFSLDNFLLLDELPLYGVSLRQEDIQFIWEKVRNLPSTKGEDYDVH